MQVNWNYCVRVVTVHQGLEQVGPGSNFLLSRFIEEERGVP